MILFSANKMPRITKRVEQTLWGTFMSGETMHSPSGYTAAIVANKAQVEGVGFTITYHPEFKCYTIQKEEK